MEVVWVFNGDREVPSAVFSTREKAEAWIAERRLSGMLTRYPLDMPVYDWAIASGAFKPKQPYQSEPRFIAQFSSASLEHYHYADGVPAD